jgi:hypothetical protein
VRVVAGVDGDAADVFGVLDETRMLVVQFAGEVDPGLGLVLGRVLFRVRVENAALRFAGDGKGNLVCGIRPVEQPRDDAVFTLVDRRRACLAAHRPVYGLDGHFARECRRVGFPR